MWHPDIRGYLYEIVEMFPGDVHGEHIMVDHHCYDRLEDAEIVMKALESVNHDFSSYAIVLRPVWNEVKSDGDSEKKCDLPNPDKLPDPVKEHWQDDLPEKPF